MVVDILSQRLGQKFVMNMYVLKFRKSCNCVAKKLYILVVKYLPQELKGYIKSWMYLVSVSIDFKLNLS